MKVYAITGESPLYETTYLLVKQDKVLIIDPGVPSERVLAACDSLKASPIAVLLTHGHVDHILGAEGLQDAGVKVYAHKTEFEVIGGRANLALAMGISLSRLTPDVALSDDDVPDLAPFDVRVIFTPGHTQGSVSYLIDGCLFSGDTLFAGSYGRTDFPTGDEQDLICSICNVLFELPAETPVYSGHNGAVFGESSGGLILAKAETTIGQEYSSNQILNLL